MANPVPATPNRVRGFYDKAFWDSVADQEMRLQRCGSCGAFRYPPGPVCPQCLSDAVDWTPVSGTGTILSWAVFHRIYLPAYPPPYNVIAVRLAEGPIMISNLEGDAPEGSWIGHIVRLIYVPMPDAFILPRFVLASTSKRTSAQ